MSLIVYPKVEKSQFQQKEIQTNKNIAQASNGALLKDISRNNLSNNAVNIFAFKERELFYS